MRTTLITAAFLAAARLCVPLSFGADPSRANPAVPAPDVTISTPNVQYKTVEEVGVDFKLRNLGRLPMYVQVPYERGYLCRIIVTDKRTGEEIIVKYPRGPWRRVMYRPVRVDPHFFYGRTINLGKFNPGTYELQVRYDSHPATAPKGVWTGSLLSNKITIQVEKHEPEKNLAGVDSGGRTDREFRRDSTGDGKIDTIVRYAGRRLSFLARDLNSDGKTDVWQDFRRNVTAWDSDRDELPDTWHYFREGKIFRRGYDTDRDGYPDSFEQ